MSSFKLDACRIGEAGAAGNKAGSGSSNDGQAGRSRFHLSPHALERVLHACFFVLGMGLFAPLTAILQTMDYLNIFFAQFYPSRTLYTGYNTANLMALVVLFKWGDKIWPNKRSRMVVGYSLYTLILVALPLMDFIIIDHVKHIEPRKAMELAFTVWAVGASVAGFSDAFISTVAYSQAAAIGQRYTHAFVGGRATSGLVMAALRCLSKGALRQNLSGLRQSTTIYVLIAALIVLTSVLIAGVLLPKLGPQIEALKDPQALPNVDPTQHRAGTCTFCRLKRSSQQPHPAAAKGCKDAGFGGTDGNVHIVKPEKSLKVLPIPPAGPPAAADSNRLSSWGSFSPLLQQTSGVLATTASIEQHQQHAAAAAAAAAAAVHGSLLSSKFSSHCGAKHSVWGTSKLNGQTSFDLQELKHKQGLAHVLDAALPAAEARSDSMTSHASSSTTLIPHSKQQYSIAEESTDSGSQPPSPPSSAPGSDLILIAGGHHHHHHQQGGTPHSTGTIAEAASEGSSQPSTPPSSACIDADVVVLTGKGSIELAAARSPTAAAKDQHMVVYLQSYMAAAHNVASELDTDSGALRCTCSSSHHHGGMSHSKSYKDVSDVSSGSSESGDSLSSGAIGDSWWALLKIVWPFCLAVQPAPMTTATILPLNLSSQVANWPVATAARWHVQIMMVTVQLGFFIGSALIPIKTPRRPRVTLLVMSCCMFLFAPCFAAALMMHARPYAFLALALTMHTYSGYITSTVFCVASQGFESKVAVRVQQLLVLSMGVSYVVGSCVSWIWVFIGRS